MVARSWSEVLSEVMSADEVGPLHGRPMAVVDLDHDLDAGPPAGVGELPCVVVGVGAPRGEQVSWVDVVAIDEAALQRLEEAVGRNPQASTTLVQVLRAGRRGSLEDGLTIESLAYGMLQAGPEHQRWLGEQTARAPKAATYPAPVGLERTDETLTVTLQRPEVRNAVDVGVRDGLVSAFELAGSDPGIERVELRGAGPDFSAGGDLSEFGTKPDPVTGHLVRSTRSPARALARCADRTTAYVHGASVGAGIELAALAGEVVATPDATFRLPEVALGLIPGAGGTATIPRRIGPQLTAWMALTGDTVDAETALSWGLIDRIERIER